jgi:hypothetical protein
MDFLGCVAAIAAMALAYLSSPNQRLLRRSLGRPAKVAGWLFGIGAFVAWIVGETSLPGIFAALAALMFGGVVLPYITWFFRPAPERTPR